MDIISRQDAKTQGLKFYFTGVACKHGHVCRRFVSNGQCEECGRNRARDYSRRNRSSVSARTKQWRKDNPDKDRANRLKELANRKAHPDYKARCKAERDTPKRKEYIKTYFRERNQNDPAFRLTGLLRHRLWMALKRASAGKTARCADLVGCEIPQLMSHLEQQFTDGMTWENMGEWHVDHIRPCASFDLTDPAQQRECFHFANLQPLWAADNLAKRDTWEPSAA